MRWIYHTFVRVAVVACAFCSAAGSGAGASAAAGGPEATLSSSASSTSATVSGAQIRAAADVPPTTYTVRSRPNSAGTKITLRGLSIRGLLRIAGFDPDAVDFISLVRPDGSLATLKHAEFADPPPFAEGPAIVADERGETRYLRPVRGPGSTNAHDSFAVSAALDVTVGGGVLLAVRTSASPRRTSARHAVSFGARVRFSPPGATLSYSWNFGDGTRGVGPRVRIATRGRASSRRR